MNACESWREGDPCPKCGGKMSHSRAFDNDWCDDCCHREPPIPTSESADSGTTS